MVDVNEAYDVYTDAYEFLQKKRHLSTDVTQNNLNAAAQAAYGNDSNWQELNRFTVSLKGINLKIFSS